MPKHLTDFDRGQIIGIWREGFSHEHIARSLNIPRRRVSRTIQRFRETGNFSRRKGSGRPRLTTSRQDRLIVRLAKRDRKRSASSTQTGLKERLAHPITRRTINNRLTGAGYYARRPLRKPKLNNHHKRERLQWAKKYQSWQHRQWRHYGLFVKF